MSDEQELLLSWRPWLRKVAKGMTNRLSLSYVGDIAEDLAQEGWIALWRATKTYDGRGGVELDYWLKRNAHDRMRVVLRFLMAKCRDINRTQLAGDPWAQLDMYSDFSSENAWAALVTDLGDIEMAYHDGEIMAAINRLPRTQRQYVIRKFWHGWDPTALDIYFNNAKYTWRLAKRNLAEQLSHLEAR
jgi:DNA-directed RNA polymerase specialized sigma24 family protein